ncbi:MAG: transketolase C-terminal domain-containing protein, partial [Bacteroidales bacterium]|nr:transketolase C-terminal domain-containing protein [Bacteroidales bacterium]
GPACFYVALSLEEVKVDVAYSHYPVRVLGVRGGLSYGALGASHHSLHDIAVLRTFPGMHIVLPADIYETRRLVESLMDYPHPVYIRVGRNAVPNVHGNTEIDFKIGKAIRLATGKDLTLIATGETVYHCLEASRQLSERGIQAGVLDMHSLKPFDTEAVLQAAEESGRIITVEEHSMFGGLGAAVAETLVQHKPVPVKILGIPDENAIAGTPLELFRHYGLDAEGIIKTAVNWLQA